MWLNRIKQHLSQYYYYRAARGYYHTARRYSRAARRAFSPLSQETLDRSFLQFGKIPTNYLKVHSSLSGCGHVLGGVPSLVGALRRWIADKNLVMPTHTFCYPDASGYTPCFDPKQTASLVGQVTDYFWRQPGVRRSLHPTHSVACEGPDASFLCANHENCETPCGQGTPYEKLVKCDCSVLMYAATLNTYTLFYTAMDAAHVPYLYLEHRCKLNFKMPDGKQGHLTMRRQNVQIPRRFAEMDSWMEERGLLVRKSFRLGQLLFIPHAGELHRCLVRALQDDPWLLVAQDKRQEVEARYGHSLYTIQRRA